MTEPITKTPYEVLYDDPFRKPEELTGYRGREQCAIDAYHFAALVVQSMSEGLGPPLSQRSLYDQRILDTFLPIIHGNPRLLQEALHAIVYADNLIVPNVDLFPGDLMWGKTPVMQYAHGGGYMLESEQYATYLGRLAPFALDHPIGRQLRLTPESYKDAVDMMLGFRPQADLNQQSEPACRFAAVTVILQELRSVMFVARELGVPGLTHAQDQWPAPGIPSGDAAMAAVRLYFDEAVYTPNPRSIKEALELREHPRVAKWRGAMRGWAAQLASGEINPVQIGEAIQEANNYIQGGKFVKDLIPSWSVLATFSISLLNTTFGGLPPAIGLLPLAVSGVKAYGHLVWAGISSRQPSKHGWYLLSEKGK